MNTPTTWERGAPPKPGAYRVRCEGPSPNTGYRYWTGERWGCLCQTRAYCIKSKGTDRRKVTLKRAVLWERKNPDYLNMDQQKALLVDALKAAVDRQAYQPGRGPEWWENARAALAKVGAA